MKIGAGRMVSFVDRAARRRMNGASSATMVREARPQT